MKYAPSVFTAAAGVSQSLLSYESLISVKVKDTQTTRSDQIIIRP